MRAQAVLLSSAMAIAALGWSGSAKASGDGGCDADWSVTTIGFDGCNNSPALQPGNDTRATMLMLMLDGRGIAPSTSRDVKGESWEVTAYSPFLPWSLLREYYLPSGHEESYARGSRCSTKDSGAEAFVAAVTAASGLKDEERSALITARKDMKVECAGGSTPGIALAELAPRLISPEAKGFGAYLEGALAFYDGRQSDAAGKFEQAAQAKNGWLADTARYMVARAMLNGASDGLYDKYGYRDDKVALDATKVKASEDAFNAYLKAFPKGRYVASARGLLRRVWWLGGDYTRLDGEYARLLADPNQSLADLSEEIDIKYLQYATSSKNPIILAAMDMVRMRGGGSYAMEACCGKPLTAEELAGQADVFAKHPALYDYLKAAHAFYVNNNAKEVLRLIPDAAKQKEFSHVQFARQMLRGEALAASKDRNTRGFLIDMLSGAKSTSQRSLVELAIAQQDEKNGQIGRVFAKGSPVQNPMIRRVLLTNSADAPLLRQQAKNKGVSKEERELATFILLKKQLQAGLYKAFLDDLALIPAGTKPQTEGYFYPYAVPLEPPLGIFTGAIGGSLYPCPAIKSVATTLNTSPKDSKAQLCLADFMRTRLDSDWYGYSPDDKSGNLGSTKSPLDKKTSGRMAIYQRLIADPKVTGDDKAYALHRAIRCFETSGYNHCGDQDIPVAQRKSWFQQLKRDYPDNPIATSLKYYW